VQRVIALNAVQFAYGRRGSTILSGLDLAFSSGRTVLLGSNGAGKSTLLGLLAGCLTPRSGAVEIAGVPRGASARTVRRARARLVGWMPQDVRAHPGLTTRQQVAYAAWLAGLPRREAWERAALALEQVDLLERQNARAAHLSGGQLRRVGLAEALVTDPSVLLLDEPTSGLDPVQRATFRDLVMRLGSERTVIVSTHHVDDLGDLFDHVVVLHEGVVRFQGTTGEFLALAPTHAPRPAESAYGQVMRGDST